MSEALAVEPIHAHEETVTGVPAFINVDRINPGRIARALSNLPLYKDQGVQYNLAGRCCWMALYLWHRTKSADVAMFGLFHFSANAVLGIISSNNDPEIARIALEIKRAVYGKLALPSITDEEIILINQAFNQSVYTEKRYLVPELSADIRTDELTNSLGPISQMQPWLAELAFLSFYDKLKAGQPL